MSYVAASPQDDEAWVPPPLARDACDEPIDHRALDRALVAAALALMCRCERVREAAAVGSRAAIARAHQLPCLFVSVSPARVWGAVD